MGLAPPRFVVTRVRRAQHSVVGGMRMAAGLVVGRDWLRILLFTSFLALVLAASLFAGPVYEPDYLLLVLNTVFIAFGGLAVSWLSARSYQHGAPMSILLIGSGTLVMAISAVISGFLVEEANVGATVYNLSFALAAVLQLGNGALLTMGHVGSRYRGPNGSLLLGAYLFSAALVMLATTFASASALPAFFESEPGGTQMRSLVLSVAMVCFVVGGALIEFRHRDVRSPVLGWYSLGLGLFAVGMFGVALESGIGDPVGWAGRIAQYAGSVCLLLAVVAAYLQPDAVEGWTRAFSMDRMQFRRLFDSMGEGFAYHRTVEDGKGRPVDFVYLEMNSAYSRITGVGPEAIGRRATTVRPGIGRDSVDWIGTYGKVARTRGPIRFEAYSSNMKRWYSVAAYSPAERHFATIIEDVTSRKKMEEEVERSNRELQQFAYVSSHDLQEPLRMVRSYLELLERKYGDELDARAKEYIGLAVDGSRRMKDLIDDLLSYSRVHTDSRPLTEVDMNKVCDEAMRNLAETMRRNGAKIRIEKLPRVHADQVQMVQLMQNLLSNAVKFHGAEAPSVSVRASEDDKEWTLRVQDNGIGIEPQYQQKVFEMFQRLHSRGEYEGTGIGLAVSKSIVERHGGRIWVESDGRNGSTFCFTLPKIPPQGVAG